MSVAVADRAALWQAIRRAGLQSRPCPVQGMIEVFTDSPTEPGFSRWVEFPYTAEGLAPLGVRL